jgi:hypothetical protein
MANTMSLPFGAILAHTETIRAELADRFAADRKGELDCWVTTAHQREAMVVQVYDNMNLEARVPSQAPEEAGIVELVRKTIGSIWAQETSHATLIRSLLRVDDPSRLQLSGLKGAVEGLMTRWVTSGGLLGTLASGNIWAAAKFKAAPDFTKHLRTMSLGQFFALSAELELTASNGYARILNLLAELERAGEPPPYGLFSRYEFATTLAEERFHQGVFERLGSWLKDGGGQLKRMEPRSALAELSDVAHEHLRLSKVEGVPPELEADVLESVNEPLISDGGLGAVFAAYDMPLPVSPRPVPDSAA